MCPKLIHAPNDSISPILQLFSPTIRLKSPSQAIAIVNTSDVSNFVAPLDILNVEYVATFPEGYTLQVSIEYSITADPPDITSGFQIITETHFIRIYPSSNR